VRKVDVSGSRTLPLRGPYARIYVKDLDRGLSSVALSPEEQEAVERAMSR